MTEELIIPLRMTALEHALKTLSHTHQGPPSPQTVIHVANQYLAFLIGTQKVA
jgi:hypothetical protein